MKYMRRILSIICIATMLLSLVGCTSWRKTDNVFEQLYYEVRSVKRGNDSILLTGTDTAYADYDPEHPELLTDSDIAATSYVPGFR